MAGYFGNLKLPQKRSGNTTKFRVGRYRKGELTQDQLKGLAKCLIKRGEVVNPYGCVGRERGKYRYGIRVGSRDGCLKKRREKILEARARALEVHELQEMARVNATRAMRNLIDIMSNPRSPEAARIAAAAIVLDRGYGKASQTNINANVNANGKENEIDSSTLDDRIGRALKRVEELTGGARKAAAGKKRSSDVRKYH